MSLALRQAELLRPQNRRDAHQAQLDDNQGGRLRAEAALARADEARRRAETALRRAEAAESRARPKADN